MGGGGHSHTAVSVIRASPSPRGLLESSVPGPCVLSTVSHDSQHPQCREHQHQLLLNALDRPSPQASQLLHTPLSVIQQILGSDPLKDSMPLYARDW